jgi:hypothetical protein
LKIPFQRNRDDGALPYFRFPVFQNELLSPTSATASTEKTCGAIECLLIQHRRIKQNAGAVGKVALAAVAVVGATWHCYQL